MKIILWVLAAAYAAWLGAWFWAFSFAYGNGFFRYNLATRLPVLLLALGAVAVPPLSAWLVLRKAAGGDWSKAKAWLVNLGVTALPLAAFWALMVAAVQIARAFGRKVFSADDAMGVGIDFMLCAAVVVAFDVVVGVWLLGLHLYGRRRNTG
jgi:hypothetical protein